MSSILSNKDVLSVLNRYKDRIKEFGVSFDSMRSGSIEKQIIRHQIHISSIRTTKPEILDIGCGLGHLYIYLKDQNIDCLYSGYDILEEYVEKCKQDFPQANFYQRNIFEQGIDGQYDNIIMSQVLNNRYKHSDNWEVMKTALAMAFQHSRIAVSVDMMSTYVDFQSEELFYYNPEQVFQFAKTLTPRVILRHDYRPYEFCIQLYHIEADGYVP